MPPAGYTKIRPAKNVVWPIQSCANAYERRPSNMNTCILCGKATPRGIICATCARQQVRQDQALYTSMTTDYLQTRREARSIRILNRKRYGK